MLNSLLYLIVNSVHSLRENFVHPASSHTRLAYKNVLCAREVPQEEVAQMSRDKMGRHNEALHASWS